MLPSSPSSYHLVYTTTHGICMIQEPVITANGQVVPFVSSAKLLGVTIQSHLRWDQHVDNITAKLKANSKRYFLAVLRRAGVQSRVLLQFYTTFVRPTVEYAAPVWHAGITAKQCDQLEAVQLSSLRTIFPDLSNRQALLHTRLPTLHDRRVNLCRTFAASSLANADLAHWFPSRRSDCHTYNLRHNHQRGLPVWQNDWRTAQWTILSNNSINEPIA